ncbi:hypothetical protein Q6264_29820, partial [Klebsiella pneumoniae]|uniref:hypothetical protein n=1 Tax=Klebsiella pneumoniae TaxID=573 RepID=UPI0027318CAC
AQLEPRFMARWVPLGYVAGVLLLVGCLLHHRRQPYLFPRQALRQSRQRPLAKSSAMEVASDIGMNLKNVHINKMYILQRQISC